MKRKFGAVSATGDFSVAAAHSQTTKADEARRVAQVLTALPRAGNVKRKSRGKERVEPPSAAQTQAPRRASSAPKPAKPEQKSERKEAHTALLASQPAAASFSTSSVASRSISAAPVQPEAPGRSSRSRPDVRPRQESEWLEDDAIEPEVPAPSMDDPPIVQDTTGSEGDREWYVRLRLKQKHLANLWSRRLTNNDTVVWWAEQQSWAPILAIPELLAAVRQSEQAAALGGLAAEQGAGRAPNISAHLAAEMAVADVEDEELNSLLVRRGKVLPTRAPRSNGAAARASGMAAVPGAPRVPTFGAGLLRGVVQPPSSRPQADNPYALPSGLGTGQTSSSRTASTVPPSRAAREVTSASAGEPASAEHSESVVPVTASLQREALDAVDIDVELPKARPSVGRLISFAAGVVVSLAAGYLAFGAPDLLGAETRTGHAAEAAAMSEIEAADLRANAKTSGGTEKTSVVSADELPVLSASEAAGSKLDGETEASPAQGTNEPAQGSKKKKKKSGAAGSGQRFDVASARQALAWAAAQVKRCATGEASGTLTVTFAPSGAVTHAAISGLKGGDGISKSCVVRAFKNAHVPPFSGEAKTVRKSFSVK